MRIFIFMIRPGIKEIQDEWERSTRFTLCEPSQRILTGTRVNCEGEKLSLGDALTNGQSYSTSLLKGRANAWSVDGMPVRRTHSIYAVFLPNVESEKETTRQFQIEGFLQKKWPGSSHKCQYH